MFSFEEIVDCRNNAYLLDVRCVRVFCYAELSLICIFDASEVAFGIFGKFVCNLACILCRFFNHFRFQVVERGVEILHAVFVVRAYGYA